MPRWLAEHLGVPPYPCSRIVSKETDLQVPWCQTTQGFTFPLKTWEIQTTAAFYEHWLEREVVGKGYLNFQVKQNYAFLSLSNSELVQPGLSLQKGIGWEGGHPSPSIVIWFGGGGGLLLLFLPAASCPPRCKAPSEAVVPRTVPEYASHCPSNHNSQIALHVGESSVRYEAIGRRGTAHGCSCTRQTLEESWPHQHGQESVLAGAANGVCFACGCCTRCTPDAIGSNSLSLAFRPPCRNYSYPNSPRGARTRKAATSWLSSAIFFPTPDSEELSEKWTQLIRTHKYLVTQRALTFKISIIVTFYIWIFFLMNQHNCFFFHYESEAWHR